MTRQDILAKVTEIIADQLTVDVNSIKEDTTIGGNNGLAVDSLDLVEIIMAVEEAFDIEIPEGSATQFVKIADLVNFIEEQTNNK